MLAAPFGKARDMCELQGGMLAVPLNAEANSALLTRLGASTHDRMWIGVSDAEREGEWAWRHRLVTREVTHWESVALEFFNWAGGQPDGGRNEACVEMWSNGLWNDAPCGDVKAFACEVPQPPRAGFTFPCSDRIAAEMGWSSGDATPLCEFSLFGTDGRRPSPEKHDFAACRHVCEVDNAPGMMAEPTSRQQQQYLARALRESGDDSMWVGLTPTGGNAGPTAWQWLSNDEALTHATSSWAHGQPDNDGQCVEMWGDATWNDRACEGDFYSNKVCACEVPSTASAP